jgi:hypothetical protein
VAFKRLDGVTECVGLRLEIQSSPEPPTVIEADGNLDVMIRTSPAHESVSRSDTVEVLRVFVTKWSANAREALLAAPR